MKRALYTLPLLALLAACSSTPENTTTAEDTLNTATTATADGDWQLMLDGNSKDGWQQLNGQADYEVNDGVVTGTTKQGEPNSFLATQKDYDDFILEYEVMVDTALNSGVQIRSHQYPADTTITITNSDGEQQERETQKDRVYGYQVEIDPSPRAYSGGIYEEARRGWLNDLSENEAARNAFKNGEWNKYRVEAMGDTIRTYINGVPAADLVDPEGADSGFIALQVHSIPEGEGPYQVMWRNIRIKEM